MAEQEGVVLRAIDWVEMFPWLRIIKGFRLAVSLQSLVLGGAAVLLTFLGWSFLAGDYRSVLLADGARPVIERMVPSQPTIPFVSTPGFPGIRWQTGGPYFESWGRLSQPVWQIFAQEYLTFSGFVRLVLSAFWTLAVWAFFGAAITRTAAVQLTAGEKVGWGEALRWARAKWLSYFAAPVFPLLGVALVTLCMAIGGLFLRADWSVYLIGLVWFLFLLGGLVMAVLLTGLVFGWPLMWATLSCEGKDSFDALSRTYAYVFQRPLRYLFYALFAALIGWLGWLLVSNFAAAVIWLAGWGASWGCGAERWNELMTASGGAEIIRFWGFCVKLLAVGFFFSYFWSASTAIYLLLRRDVDAMEMDEVYLQADESEEQFGTPAEPIEKRAVPPAIEPVASVAPAAEAIKPTEGEPPANDGSPSPQT